MSMPPPSSTGYGWLVNRVPPGMRQAVTRKLKAAHDQCADNRRRVLKYPEIAELLIEHPLDYATPSLWTGYIPPATYPGQFSDLPNTSPRREAFLQMMFLVDEAERKAPVIDTKGML